MSTVLAYLKAKYSLPDLDTIKKDELAWEELGRIGKQTDITEFDWWAEAPGANCGAEGVAMVICPSLSSAGALS